MMPDDNGKHNTRNPLSRIPVSAFLMYTLQVFPHLAVS